MIDRDKIQALIDTCPLTPEVKGIVTHVEFDVTEDWSGDEAVYLKVFMVDPNSADLRVLDKGITYAECMRARLTEAGILAYVKFPKSRRRPAAGHRERALAPA